MAENKRIVVVGIPGVGKTSLLAKMLEILGSKHRSVTVISFGTTMFDIAKENGVGDRDQLRDLPISEQKELQKAAASRIAGRSEQIVIIDTHAFVRSQEGYYPGLPAHVLEIIRPTNFVSVTARPEEIFSRRVSDMTRKRDKINILDIKKELAVQSGMMSACSVITGSPIKQVLNGEGKIDEAADKIIRSMEL
ncbi:MAG: adenylate kinase [Nitrosopumilaceae archaeon]|nr:adenylate kinase [Nitrosopumilaceae archaeon]